jgi:hypothetical protein
MAITQYIRDLSVLDYLRVWIETSDRGRTVLNFRVQYEGIIAGKVYPIVRYDNAHGDPHRDLLDDEARNIDKLWLAGWEPGRALNHALDDLADNFLTYRADFVARLHTK